MISKWHHGYNDKSLRRDDMTVPDAAKLQALQYTQHYSTVYCLQVLNIPLIETVAG